MVTSNPVNIRLTDLVGQTVLAAAIHRFLDENLAVNLDSWEAHPAKAIFDCTPGKNHPDYAPYGVNIMRRSDGVWGVCTCAADRLCKHLAGAFLMFQALENGHSRNRSETCPGCQLPPPPPPPPHGGRILVEPAPVLKRNQGGRGRGRRPAKETKEIAAQVDRAIAADVDRLVAQAEQEARAATATATLDPWNDIAFCGCGAEMQGLALRCDACQEAKDRQDIFG